jgi:NADH-quinone oxidoreductase subunit F
VGFAKKTLKVKTICPLGEAAAWPVAAAIRHFRSEFEEFVKNPTRIKDVKTLLPFK